MAFGWYRRRRRRPRRNFRVRRRRGLRRVGYRM